MVGELLAKLDQLGIADDTIVIYGTGTTAPRRRRGPTAAPRRTTARRAPRGKAGSACRCVVRWPGVIKPGTIIDGVMSQEKWMPTLLAAAGEPDIVQKLKQGYEVGGKTFRI